MNHLSSHLICQLQNPLELESFHRFQFELSPEIVRPNSHPGWSLAIRDGWTSNAIQSRPMMEALLAISLLHQSRHASQQRFKAIQYYGSAISHLRQLISGTHAEGSERELLYIAASCAFFEVIYSTSFQKCDLSYKTVDERRTNTRGAGAL